ncbi:oxidoreductase [Tunturiibacter gelidoferens]|uniref:Dehydrogenase n=1 Tax=Tunturiibacter gelidiferens TaxID=3069689 RepID=A0ACC5NW44_9BACT|nr:oxidoreductase [Edaphobacter lichenicola]MBB5338821.1 putative dehydrogenase [Edaphobacter lichenicola]
MSGNSRRIRVGLIGYGYAGKIFHAPLIRAVPGLALTMVGSSRPEVVRKDLGEIAVCSPAEVAIHPDVDLVVIASPNDSHYPLASAALRAGKDVVVDKPFTVTLAEARSLLQIAEEQGRMISVFHNRRWESEIQATRAVLQSGALGVVSHYECHMDRYRPHVRQRWREDEGPGAGLWFDLGPHLIDQTLYLFGLPQSISASFATLREGGKTDDWAHVQLNYERMRTILHASLLVSRGGPRTIVHGTRASWMKYGADVQEAQLKEGMVPGSPGFGYDPHPGLLYDGETGRRTEIPAPLGNQQMYYMQIRDAILGGQREASIPGIDAVAVMAVLETTFHSAKQGRVLPLSMSPDEIAQWRRAHPAL